MDSIEKKPTKKAVKAKAPAKAKAKKAPKGKKIAEQKDKSVSQVVNLTIQQGKRSGKGRPKKTAPAPAGGLAQSAQQPVQQIAKRDVLVNVPSDNLVQDKNLVYDPVTYLESNVPKRNAPVAVKSKKGQNPYNTEIELQQETFQFKPTSKGRNLTESVIKQPKITIKKEHAFTANDYIDLEPNTQFVKVDDANTDKIVAYDTQAEGTEEVPFNKAGDQSGIDMPAKSKRGRKPKYATEEERKAAKQEQTKESKIRKQLTEKGVILAGYGRGKIPAEEDETLTHLLQPKLTKSEKAYLSEPERNRDTQQRRSEMMGDTTGMITQSFNDNSLNKMFGQSVNYSNNTNNNPVKQSLDEYPDDYPADTETEMVNATYVYNSPEFY